MRGFDMHLQLKALQVLALNTTFNQRWPGQLLRATFSEAPEKTTGSHERLKMGDPSPR